MENIDYDNVFRSIQLHFTCYNKENPKDFNFKCSLVM